MRGEQNGCQFGISGTHNYFGDIVEFVGAKLVSCLAGG
jgi:hypothetical protein